MLTFRFSSAGKLCANALILAACVAAIQGSAHAGLVLDPGFESATPADYNTGPIGDGWSVLSGAIGIFANGSVGTAHSGVQFADLDLGATQNQMSQDITTTIGQMYTISFWLSDDVGSNPFSATFGGTTLDTIPSTPALGKGNYEFLTFTATATGVSTALTFEGQYTNAGPGAGTLIDDVSVTPTSTTPEPSSWILFAGGAGLLGLARFRRFGRAV